MITSILRAVYRKHLPYDLRRRIAQTKTWLHDHRKGLVFATVSNQVPTPISCTSITQRIMPSKTYDNKVHNLAVASGLVEQVLILPNQVFSFSKTVGNPTAKRGFKCSRALVNGVLEQVEGGGLCQLSGLIYQVALTAQLDIVERHNHSIDIYTEDTRFTPLGSDATIVYGFKDLRIRNSTPYPLRFGFSINTQGITATLYSTNHIPIQHVAFVRLQESPNKIVHTKNSENKTIAVSTYQLPQ